MHMPARITDPITSHEAAEYITVSGKRAAQQELTAKAVEQYPGHTSFEIARHFRMDRYMLARRLSECEEAGLLRRGQVKRCDISKRMALTWWPPGEVEQLSLPMGEARAA